MREFLGIDKLSSRMIASNLILIFVGSLIAAIGINAFLVPHKFLSCGVSGLSQFFSYLTPMSVGTYVLLLNIPIFLLGWFTVGRVFVFGSAIGLLMFSGCLYGTEWMAHAGWEPERLLSALIGGTLSGGGTGLVFRANSSHAGIDIVAAAIKKRWSISIGTVSFGFNIFITALLGVVFGLHAALYTIVSLFCAAIALDKVMIGIDNSRAIFIISSKPEEIADLILKKLERGVTFLEGEGAYLGKKQKVIYCVVTLRQLARVKYYVKSVDPNAFLTVAEVNEVAGKGFRPVPI
ncbi:MAG: YitT family protein [Pseudomonadota bacterium]